MKKSIALLMALVCTLAFAGCKAVEQDTNTQAPQVINPEVKINFQIKPTTVMLMM